MYLGDILVEDDVVAQIETDKVTIDVRYTGTSPAKITELLVKDQDTVTVGQAVVKVRNSTLLSSTASRSTKSTSINTKIPKRTSKKNLQNKRLKKLLKKHLRRHLKSIQLKWRMWVHRLRVRWGLNSEYAKWCVLWIVFFLKSCSDVTIATESCATFERSAKYLCFVDDLQRGGHVEHHGNAYSLQRTIPWKTWSQIR